MQIGNIKLKSRVFLAPMMEITSLPYRLLCRKYGAGMTYSEMIVANSLVSNPKLDSAKTAKEEKPVGLQLAGNNSELILRAAKTADFDLVDLNFGCPSDKVAGNDMCSSLLEKPEKIGKIISYLVDNLDKPVTAKIRLGYKTKTYMKVAEAVEKAGASAICLHGRTAEEHYDIEADWKAICEVKKKIGIPVIGNGDVFDGESAKELLKKVDFVMVGRAAIGNPFVFDRINRYLKNGEIADKPNLEEKYKCFLEYVKLCEKYGFNKFTRIRRMSLSFAKNVPNSAKLREKLSGCKSIDEIKREFEEFI